MDPITGSQLKAAVLELKTEFLEALHATESRIVGQLAATTATLDRRVSSIERDCSACRAETRARLDAALQGGAARQGNGSLINGGTPKPTLFTDPKFYTALCMGVAALVWFLVERIIPFLQHVR